MYYNLYRYTYCTLIRYNRENFPRFFFWSCWGWGWGGALTVGRPGERALGQKLLRTTEAVVNLQSPANSGARLSYKRVFFFFFIFLGRARSRSGQMSIDINNSLSVTTHLPRCASYYYGARVPHRNCRWTQLL